MDHPLSAVRNYLFSLLTATLGRSTALCHRDWDRLDTGLDGVCVRGGEWSCWLVGNNWDWQRERRNHISVAWVIRHTCVSAFPVHNTVTICGQLSSGHDYNFTWPSKQQWLTPDMVVVRKWGACNLQWPMQLVIRVSKSRLAKVVLRYTYVSGNNALFTRSLHECHSADRNKKHTNVSSSHKTPTNGIGYEISHE